MTREDDTITKDAHGARRTRQREIEDLFDRVRLLPEGEREAAIVAGSAEPTVRDEVRSLLRFDGATAHPTRSEPLARFDADLLVGIACGDPESGGFEIRRLIGTGGMGAVFEAEQRRPQRRVAVKVLGGGATRASALRRFLRESEFLAQLDHPNIARVISAGTLRVPVVAREPAGGGAGSDAGLEGGHGTRHGTGLASGVAATSFEERPYFAMELIDGGLPITRWADGHGAETEGTRADPPSCDAVLRNFIDACDAIGVGHRLGIVHLDLKPGNLLVGRDGRLRVIDFGIARSIEPRESERGVRGSRTREGAAHDGDGVFVGTPQYMSPEQFCAPPAGLVDSRSDVYALGLILFELLARRLPYETRGLSPRTAERVVRETVPPSLELVDSSVPRALAAIVAKALAKDPDARYGTASELGDDLRRFLADEPMLAVRDTTAEAIARLLRRNRLAGSFTILATVAVLAAAAVSVLFALDAGRARLRAERETARANIRAAASALREGDLADAAIFLERVPAALRGWESAHTQTALARFRPLVRTDTEIIRCAVAPATDEVAAGITGGYIMVVDPKRPELPSEIHDLRPLFAETPPVVPYAMEFSPDARTIDCVTESGELLEVRRANAADGRAAEVVHIRSGVWWSKRCGGGRLLFAPGGLQYAAGLAGDALLSAPAPVEGSTIEVTATADGRLIAIGAVDGSVALYEVDPEVDPEADPKVDPEADPGVDPEINPEVNRGADPRVKNEGGAVGPEGAANERADRPASGSVTRRWRTTAPAGASRAVAIAHDKSFVLAVQRDFRIRKYDARTGALIAERDLPGGSVYDMAIAPDGRTAALSSWTNVLRVVDTETLEVVDWLGGGMSHIWGIAYSADGRSVYGRCCLEGTEAAGGPTSEWLVAYDAGGGIATRDVDLGASITVSSSVPRDGVLAAIDATGRLLSVHLATGVATELCAVQGTPTTIDRDARTIVVGFDDGTIRSFERRSRDGRGGDETEERRVRDVVAEPVDGEPAEAEAVKAEDAKAEVATAGDAKNEAAKIEDAKTESANSENAKAGDAKNEAAKIEAAKIEDDGGDGDGRAWRERWRVSVVGSAVTCVRLSPDGTRIVCGGRSREAIVLDAVTGEVLWRVQQPAGDSPDNRLRLADALFPTPATVVLVPIDGGAPVEVRRLSNGAVLERWASRHWETEDATLIDGECIALVNITGHAAILRPDEADDGTRFARNGGLVTTDADATRLFVAGRDGSLRVASIEPLDELARLGLPAGAPIGLAFDRGRGEVTVLTNRGLLRTWRAAPPPQLSEGPSPLDALKKQKVAREAANGAAK